jgi:hypothetical protein
MTVTAVTPAAHMAAGVVFTGSVSIGSIITLLTALVGFATVIANQRKIHARADEITETVRGLDAAVNGKKPHEQTLRENVQDLHDRQSHARTRVTDAE